MLRVTLFYVVILVFGNGGTTYYKAGKGNRALLPCAKATNPQVDKFEYFER